MLKSKALLDGEDNGLTGLTFATTVALTLLLTRNKTELGEWRQEFSWSRVVSR